MRTIAVLMILCLAAVALPGCKSVGAAFPRIYDLPYAYPEDAPPEWKKGWEQGCKSGLSAYGNLWYKSLYKFEQDIKLLDNGYYTKGWQDSFNYCRGYINRVLAGENIAGDKHQGIFSTGTLNFWSPGGDLRDSSLISQRYGLELDPWFGGTDIPGYGNMAWGSNVSCESDWLGRKPEGCGWTGYGGGGGH